MGHAIFELETIGKLPLWAQVLMAARMARRAVLAMPKGVDASMRATLLEGCEAMERSAIAGTWSRAEQPAVRKAMELRQQGGRDAGGAAEAVYLAGDACHAAHDSLDFGAAESACEGSARRAMEAAGSAKGLNPLQGMTFMAADLEVLRFACQEAGVGRYDGLGSAVMGRMFPVYAPENGEVEKPDLDQLR